MINLMVHLTGFDCEIVYTVTPSEGLNLINKQPFDLFLLESRLPEMSGVEVCHLIRQTDAETPIVFFTVMARDIDRREAVAAGASEYLVKPNDLDRVTDTIT